jgi:hypothetical protein
VLNFTKSNDSSRVGRVAEVVEHLPSKHRHRVKTPVPPEKNDCLISIHINL